MMPLNVINILSRNYIFYNLLATLWQSYYIKSSLRTRKDKVITIVSNVCVHSTFMLLIVSLLNQTNHTKKHTACKTSLLNKSIFKMSHKFKTTSSTLYYNPAYSSLPSKENDDSKMHGIQRVIIFCCLTTVLPTILIVLPLYLRNIKYADVMYSISDSDVIQIHQGQSSIFCEKHSLKMNTSFNAFQMSGRPELSNKRRHITLKKSMTLPDDTLEYWGFYLFAGATVELKACSRYEGSKILVVKGQKILNTCGILDGSKLRKEPPIIETPGHVLVMIQNPNLKKRNNLTISKQLEDNALEQFSEETTEGIETNYTNRVEALKHKFKRDTGTAPVHSPNTVLDAGVNHGGNAINNSLNAIEDSSVSSFENSLHECYRDNIYMNDFFPYSIQCNNTNYLEKTTTLKVVHDVLADGYYYYIFYSDNDMVINDIHVIFDIYKPTFQYANMSDSKICLNKTECEFNVELFSDELVIVEVPTKDGLRSDSDNSSILISVCHPRMSVYIIFPVSVLLLIIVFAFL